jgi:TolA-binding protein
LLDDHEAAEALPLFRQYCQHSPAGTLVPEAMAGQARSLERLSRNVEARALWQELLLRFPDSVYARTKPMPDPKGGTP